MSTTILLPFQPDAMTPAQLAAVSYLARYAGHTHTRYASQLRRWFAWCEASTLDPLVDIHRAHIELYVRHLGESGLMALRTRSASPFARTWANTWRGVAKAARL